MKLREEKGVISLEACIMVPVFIFIILFVYGIMIMFMGQQLMVHALFQSAQSLSLDSYALELVSSAEHSNGEQLIQDLYTGAWSAGADRPYFTSSQKWYAGEASMESVIKKRFFGYLAGREDKADDILDLIGVKDGKDGISFAGSSVSDGVLTIKLKYTQEYIYNFYGLASFEREITVKADMWGL